MKTDTDSEAFLEYIGQRLSENPRASHSGKHRAAFTALRTLIEAAFFEGYTHHELSARFGVPLGTVKTRIRTGLVSLRVRLEQTA